MRTALLVLILAAALASGFLASPWSASCADEGLGMDPSGGCGLAPQSDAGLGMDPNGKPAPQGDEGLGMDPNG